MFSKMLENSSSSFVVEGEVVLGMNTHIVHIDLKPFLGNHVCANVVHKCLEGGGHIGEAEEHDCWFVKPKGGDEGCFPLVLFSQLDVVISPLYIELGEEGGVLHVVNEFQDKR